MRIIANELEIRCHKGINIFLQRIDLQNLQPNTKQLEKENKRLVLLLQKVSWRRLSHRKRFRLFLKLLLQRPNMSSVDMGITQHMNKLPRNKTCVIGKTSNETMPETVRKLAQIKETSLDMTQRRHRRQTYHRHEQSCTSGESMMLC